MRNPNGYGSVVKLSGNRRRPFFVRKTVGFNKKGHPIYEAIGYTQTREEGMILLAEYNRDPWNIDAKKITLLELWEVFQDKKLPKFSKGSIGIMKSTFKNHFTDYYDCAYVDIKAYHMQDTIDNCGLTYSTQGAIKNIWRKLDKLALELDISKNMYSQLLTSDSTPESSGKCLTDEHINVLWDHCNDEWVQTVLIFLYSGFRRNELLEMKISDVDMEEKTFCGGKKSDAGKNRIVPIHSLIFDFVKDRVENNKKYIIERNQKIMVPTVYYIFWNGVMEKFGMNYTPHHCRHTFRSLLDSAGANKKAIDMMMGHKSKDVGERVYTHKTIDELRQAIELVTR